jgi:hypothetical protein
MSGTMHFQDHGIAMGVEDPEAYKKVRKRVIAHTYRDYALPTTSFFSLRRSPPSR